MKASSPFKQRIKRVTDVLTDALHAKRHLQTEERAFNRTTRNLLSRDTLLKVRPKRLPSPPPEGEDPQPLKDEQDAFRRQRFREDVLLDFANFDSSLVRIQLLQSSNQRERERYASEKAKIVETANAVKENTLALRAQLAQAQEVLQQRKGYDKLAMELIPKTLKSRAETRAEIEKLEKEIEDLRQESTEFDGVWAGRREAFDRVVAEGQNAIKVIRGIKDEPEKDEQMEDGEEGEKHGKEDRSRMGTPAPGESTPMPGGSTPMLGGATPLLESGEIAGTSSPRPANRFLDVDDATRSNSRVGTPRMEAKDPVGDVEMDHGMQLEPAAKDSSGMEAKDEQVVEPAKPLGEEAEVMDES